jgi:hypothetical protein
MATIDSNIAMGYRPVQIENPLNQLAAMTQIQSGQQGQQLNALQMRKAQQEFDTQNALAEAYKGAFNPDTGVLDYSLLTRRLAEGGAGSAIPGVIKYRTEADQAAELLSKTKIDAEKSVQALTSQMQRDLSRDPSDLNIQKNFDVFVSSGLFKPHQIAAAQAKRDQLLAMPFPNRQPFLSSIGATAGELKPLIKETDIGGSILPRVLDAFSGTQISQGTPIKKTATPGEVMTDARARERLNAELQSTGTLTPAAIDVAAQIYIQTGQLPALGIGKSAGQIKSSILNRATQLYGNPAGAAPNVNPPGIVPNVNAPAGANAPAPFNALNMAEQIVGNKIDVATKTKAAKDFSTGIQGRQVTAFNTAIDHLSTMDKLSDALQNNDIKAFNYLGNVVARQTGLPAPVNFDAAKQIVTAEIIKAVVASGGGVRERQEAEANFATANSPAQLKGVINTYKQLLGGQLNSLGLQYENTTGRTDFDKKLTGEAKQAFKSVREQHSASGLPPGVGANWQLMQDKQGNKAYVNPANPKEIIEVK